MMEFFLFLAALLSTGHVSATAEPQVEAWAGHQVLSGKRKIPVYGEKETHTENYLIAEIHRSEKRIDIRQKLCRTEVRPIKGVTASMKPTTIARLPKSHLVLEEGPDSALTAEPWTTGWEAEDIDADGFPGATIQISGTKCSGDVYVSNHSVTRLVSGHATDDGVVGEISVRVKQKILGASGLCLKLIAGDSEETQTGWFAFRRVPIGSNCRSLADHPWPVKAGPPSPAAQ